MAVNTVKYPLQLRLCTFNMHGFGNGLAMAQQLCLDHDLILLQETWLSNANLYKLNSIDSGFCSFGLSGMEAKLAEGILVGRPFGGKGILWKKCFSHNITIVYKEDAHGRLLSLKLQGLGVRDIIISCTYFPCHKVTNDYLLELSDTLACFENVLIDHPDTVLIILLQALLTLSVTLVLVAMSNYVLL